MTDPRFALGSFSIAGARPFAGLVRDDRTIALDALDELRHAGRPPRDLLDLLNEWDRALPRLQAAAARWAAGDAGLAALSVPLAALRVHAPYVPRQIFATGANYRRHVIELVMGDPDMRSAELEAAGSDGERRAAAERLMDERAANAQPYVFSKLPSSIGGPCDALPLPAFSHKVDWECELVAVIGRAARHLSPQEAAGCIAGYAIANDVTARDLVFRRDVKVLGTDWVASKSQPGFTPFGPFLVPAAFVDPQDLSIRLSVNGRIMQDEHTSDMLIPIGRQIAWLSRHVQLLPGDIVCTGSPAGNGSHHGVFLKPGDVMTASITGLGEQRVTCMAG